ncbi:hypothetical protein [Lysinibacillus xylanilyticus]|uniref:hypothetical protein n=1 Tax=Lysinibacillus xylanilyticus TaxID=582475 RepID=UPI003D02392A
MEFNFEKLKPAVKENIFKQLVKDVESNQDFKNDLKEKLNENEPIHEELFFERVNEDGKVYQNNIFLKFELVNEVVEVSCTRDELPF